MPGKRNRKPPVPAMPEYYLVRTTIGIVTEMARYEGSRVKARFDPYRSQQIVEPDELIDYTIWTYLVEGTPNLARWDSFPRVSMLVRFPRGEAPLIPADAEEFK